MKMYLPFGDWSDDGHGKYEKILIDAPSMEHLLRAQNELKEKYGKSFFYDFANDCDDSRLPRMVWNALIDTDYPILRFREIENVNTWDDCSSLEEVLSIDDNPYVGLDFVIDAFIWLLNAYGAHITKVDNDIPTICNWTCEGFETVGYGCF